VRVSLRLNTCQLNVIAKLDPAILDEFKTYSRIKFDFGESRMDARSLSIIAAAASFMAASALAQNAPPKLERPTPQAFQEPPRSVLAYLQLRAWHQEVAVHLVKYKRRLDGDRVGTVVLRFVLDRTGHVVSAKVEKTSGDTVIDDAALAMLQRADPLPRPPQLLTDDELTFAVPLRFVNKLAMPWTPPRSQ
jgi:TonB family protein